MTARTLDLTALAAQYLEAWTSHDVDAIVAMHTADARFQTHGRTDVITGRDALRQTFAGILDLYPNLGCDTHRLLFGPAHWVLDWTLTFDAADGQRRGFQCLDVVEVSEGLVSRKDTYFDFAQARAAFGGQA
ncbi:nuclear transport factor 2 family protein [Nocardia altamirensis]|uniref:nuclear transport factor 2 family protein n=1 Tax=Nocardia altamirensis TaxID=472158 RepID=UPI0008404655|nr:nuclear transport factor 2 family protein [Nocardia altamirensis]